MDDNKVPVIIKLTVLGYELNSLQNAYINHLIPAIFGCLTYVIHFAVDTAVFYRHRKEEDLVWAGLTLFFMYLPVIGCFVMTVSSWEMWPDAEGCATVNVKWFLLKTGQHLLFPIWSMWRYAEKIFWSIEAVRTKNIDKRDDALYNASAPRTIEFYFFLKGFLHTIPQVLLQIHVLMKNVINKEQETVDIQVASIFINIWVMASTTVLYQRFKTQKVGGKNYPWYKPYKYPYPEAMDMVDSRAGPYQRQPRRRVGIIYATKDNIEKISKEINIQEVDSVSQTSSDFYEQADLPPSSHRALITTYAPPADEVDFPRPIRIIKALPEDDLIGKIIAFLWWLCFLIARFLAIASFSYFFPAETIWILSSHFILCVAFLLYDAKAYVVRRTKALFFIFIGVIYVFCIIEFKKQFKKAKFIYNGFFVLVFIENIVMCLIWWCTQLEDYYDIWWFRFIFYVVLLCTLLSASTMTFYNIINKPDKVVVGTEVIRD